VNHLSASGKCQETGSYRKYGFRRPRQRDANTSKSAGGVWTAECVLPNREEVMNDAEGCLLGYV